MSKDSKRVSTESRLCFQQELTVLRLDECLLLKVFL